MNILINFATRSRPDKFKHVMDHLRRFTAEPEKIIVLIKADEDDQSMNQPKVWAYLNEFTRETRIRTHITYGERSSKIGAINRDINLIKGWDVLVNISDDMLPNTPEWDNVLRTNVRRVWADTDFFAHFNDGRVNEALCTLSIIGRAYYRRDGYVYHPLYKSFSCDAEAMYVAMMRGKHHYFPEVLFRHDHAAYVKNANDQLYRENSKHSNHDTKLYFERLNQYFGIPENERTCLPFEQHITNRI